MTTLQYLYMFAAVVAGWIGIEVIGVGLFKIRVPLMFNIGSSFVAAMLMYANLFPSAN